MRSLIGSLAALALLCPAGVFAQGVTLAGCCDYGSEASGGGGGRYTGPLDVVASPAAFYSVRAASAAWADGTHKAVNIKRASDSQTCDVLLTTSGGLGNVTACSGAATGAASAFCASDTCSVVTWYDQSGNAKNASQATGANQPTLVFTIPNGGALPCVLFSGGQVLTSSMPSSVQPVTVTAVAERTGNFTASALIYGTALSQVDFSAAANKVSAYMGSTVTSVTANDNALHALVWVLNGTSSAYSVDGAVTTVGTSPGANSWSAAANIGAQNVSALQLTGCIAEVGVYFTALTTGAGNQTGNLRANQSAYWGTP